MKKVVNYKEVYNEFPSKFWVIVGASFIDRVGGTMIWPFFALYVTNRFNVGMTEAGLLLGFWAVCSSIGSMFGGALTDKIGRRSIIIFGLILSAFSSLVMGVIPEYYMFFIVVIFVGLFANIAGPAHGAMIADLLPEQKRAEGFGILRVTANLAWVIGPAIGGFVAEKSYLYLFIADAIASTITAIIIYFTIPETKPEPKPGTKEQSIWQTIRGYKLVTMDKVFMAFLLVSVLMLLVYNQLYNTLSVYLRDSHGLEPKMYGWLMSINAFSVVLFQFWVTRQVSKYAPMLMMAFGAFLYMIGFTMYGFVGTYFLFIVAMLIITFGEMVVMPVSQALVANLAPEDYRGRYMAVSGLSWAIPASVGPGLAGLILDNFNPDWVWYAGGIITAVAVSGFIYLHWSTKERLTHGTEQTAQPSVAS
jgi:MFS family permease